MRRMSGRYLNESYEERRNNKPIQHTHRLSIIHSRHSPTFHFSFCHRSLSLVVCSHSNFYSVHSLLSYSSHCLCSISLDVVRFCVWNGLWVFEMNYSTKVLTRTHAYWRSNWKECIQTIKQRTLKLSWLESRVGSSRIDCVWMMTAAMASTMAMATAITSNGNGEQTHTHNQKQKWVMTTRRHALNFTFDCDWYLLLIGIFLSHIDWRRGWKQAMASTDITRSIERLRERGCSSVWWSCHVMWWCNINTNI